MKTEMVSKVIQKFQKREAVIGIVGMGYVGIPLMLCFSEKGYKTVGFDIDDRRVNELNSGKSSIEHITNESIANAIKVGFSATTDFSRIGEVDGIILCVPTPLDKYREPDISYIVNSMESIGPYLKAGQIISLESTTYPGTTDEEIKTRVEARGLKVGENFFVVYSPEREDPGRKDYTTKTTPKVIGGCTPACLEAGICMYQQAIDTLVPVSSTKAAEMTKVLENIHRAVNIGLMNELKIVADKMGMDIHEVIRAAATKPFGFVAYHPGPGIGGHCIPIDPFYLTWKAREFGVHTKFIELAGEINSSMPHYVVDKTSEALNDFSKSLRGSKVLLLGLAYKMNVDDIRESPSLEILKILQEKGAHVDYSDPHVNQFPKYPRNDEKIMKSVGLTAQTIASYDAVILATQHARFDYDLIKNHAKLIIDSRGKYSMNEKNVVRA